MKLLYQGFILIFFLFPRTIYAQNPVAIDTSLQIETMMQVKPNAVRIAKNPVDNSLYYNTYNGNIYKIFYNGTSYADTLVATSSDHHINYLQGMLFRDSMLYLVGNRTIPNVSGHGMLMAGKFQANGQWLWDTLMYTAEYPNTATLFDHSFSSMCFNPSGDSIYIGSGSRTDHGEVQSKGGLFPGVREVALTSKIYRVPVNVTEPVFLPNDSSVLDSSPYVFCRGVRNSFDLTLAPNGDLLGSENSGDRDDPEELNWLKQDHHYGFPWRMGGNETGMQFAGYDSSQDLLINHNCAAWQNDYFYNDPSYPQPNGISFSEPVKNYGPDADKFRDPLTGSVRDASDENIYITSFTSHRCPLGLAFDYNGALSFPYNRSALMLSYTPGTADTTGTVGNGVGPFSDTSQDLLQLALYKDTVSQQYSMNCYRIVSDFSNPVDAWLDDTVLYVLESHYNANPPQPRLHAVHFKRGGNDLRLLPDDMEVCESSSVVLSVNLRGKFNYQWSTGETTEQITVTPSSNMVIWVKTDNGLFSMADSININTVSLPSLPASINIIGGDNRVCPGDIRTFATVKGRGNDVFQWDVPPGAVINSGQGTNSVEVTFNAGFTSAGDISVMKTNNCGFGPLRTLTVDRNDNPDAGAISGASSGLCSSVTGVFSVDNISGYSYNWSAPINTFISNGQGTNSIIVDFPMSYFDGGVTVTTSNGCGTGSLRKLRIHSLANAPGNISGAKTVCANTTYIYSINPQPGATAYIWTGPQGCTITANAISGTTTLTTSATTVEVVYTPLPAGAELNVMSVNDCGESNARILKLFPCLNRLEAEFSISLQQNVIHFTHVSSDIYIYNLLGKMVKYIPSDKGQSELNIDRSEFAQGIYIVKSGDKSLRIVISR